MLRVDDREPYVLRFNSIDTLTILCCAMGYAVYSKAYETFLDRYYNIR